MIRGQMLRAPALLVGTALVVSLVACSTAGGSLAPSSSSVLPPPPSSLRPPAASATSGSFVLTLTALRTTWSANQPIDVSASLAFNGDLASVALAGSGSGLVGFGVKELTGRREVEGVQTSDCRLYHLDRANPLHVAFVKSGGFSGDDPDRDWKREFITDPLFRLPAGRWRVTAFANFSEGTCELDAPYHQFHVSLDLIVT